MDFRAKITALMRARGLSGRALGSALQLSNSTVSGWIRESSPSKPHASQIAQLADFFGVDVETLLDDTLDIPVAKQVLRAEEAQAIFGRRVIATDPSFSTGARQQSPLPAQLASLGAELSALSAKLYTGDPPPNLCEQLRAHGDKLHRLADQPINQ